MSLLCSGQQSVGTGDLAHCPCWRILLVSTLTTQVVVEGGESFLTREGSGKGCC